MTGCSQLLIDGSVQGAVKLPESAPQFVVGCQCLHVQDSVGPVSYTHLDVYKRQLLNLKVNVLTVRQLSDSCLQVLTIDIQPFGNRFGGVRFHNRFDLVGILACTGDRDHIASFEQIRRNVYLLAVDGEMAVTDQLSAFFSRRGKSAAVYHVVDTALQDAEQVLSLIHIWAEVEDRVKHGVTMETL